MEGFHVEGPRKLEVVRSRTAMGYIQKGQPGMANLVDREWGCLCQRAWNFGQKQLGEEKVNRLVASAVAPFGSAL